MSMIMIRMEHQQEQGQEGAAEGEQHQGDGELDDEITTLSSHAGPVARLEKEAQYSVHEERRGCCCFNTRCEFLLFLLIAILVLVAGYLVYDNRLQEGEISQILTILRQGQDYRQPAPAAAAAEAEQSAEEQRAAGTAADSRTIPRKVWYFNRKELIESRQWTQLAFQRIKTTAQEGGFELSLINDASWKGFLPPGRQRRLEALAKGFAEGQEGVSGEQADGMLRELIVLEVLREHGGIFVDEDVVLTESLEWVVEIGSNQLVNAWQLVLAGGPQVVGFFAPEMSSEPQKYARTGVQEEAEQYIVRFPSLVPTFLAAAPGSSFIADLLEEYYAAADSPGAVGSALKRLRVEEEVRVGEAGGLLGAACQLVLRKKQLQLEMDKLALEYYRVAAINLYFGPAKLRAYLGDTQADKIFNHLSLLPREELHYEFGATRYLAALAPMEKLYGLLEHALQGKAVLRGSFIHEYLMGREGEVAAVEAEQLGEQQWEALPAKLWLFLQEPAYSSSFFGELWVRHLRKTASEAGFEVLIVTDDNLHEHLPNETIRSIHEALTANKLTVYESTKKQLISLAVLHEHGGVWVEPFAFFVQGLSWLRAIAKQKFVWNRFGALPKVVAAFHPHFGSPFHWATGAAGRREAWHLAYEHSLIAAEPRAELIRDWFEQLRGNLQLDYAAVLRKFEGCKISEHRWISEENHELLSQDSIKCALGAKTLDLLASGDPRSAPELYGVWGLNGFAGLLKMREYSNFVAGRNMENPLIWRFSLEQMQAVAGNITFFTKVYDPTAARIEQLFLANADAPLREFHSRSFLMRLVREAGDRVLVREGRLYLEGDLLELEKAREAEAQAVIAHQSLAKAPKLLWVLEGGEIDRGDGFSAVVLQNLQRFAGGLEVRFVTDQNYKAWLSADSEASKKLADFLAVLSGKAAGEQSNFKDHYQRIRGEAVLLTLLYENGGVFVTKKLILHEDLSWLQKVEALDFVNSAGSAPQVFGFFSPGYSSPQTGTGHVEAPSLENFFLASGRKTQFVRDFLEEYKQVVTESSHVRERLEKLGYKYSWLHADDPYYECFFLASQFTLARKKDELTAQASSQTALEFYGLYALNTHYYPYRLYRYFTASNAPAAAVLKALAGTHLAELEAQVGPLKYFSIISKEQDVAAFVDSAIKGAEGTEVVEGSFLHRFLLPTETKSLVKKDMAYQSAPAGKAWAALPKLAWVYIPEGLKNSSLAIQLLFLGLKEAAEAAGFELSEVNDGNLERFIDKLILKKVSKLINRNNEQYKSLLYRLAILAKHGGLAFPPETLLTEDLAWVRGIADFDRRLLFSRYGDAPKVLMTVDTLRSPAGSWSYDPQRQTKRGHSIGWSEAVIAAERESELVKDWFEELTTYLDLAPQELTEVFEECKIPKNGWSAADPSRLGSDALLCVLSRKQAELQALQQQADICEYYGVWGVGESFGANKMEEGLNLDETVAEPNPFLWKRPRKQVESIIGPVRPLVRLTRKQVARIEDIISSSRLDPWGEKDSLLMSLIYDRLKGRLQELNGKVVVSL